MISLSIYPTITSCVFCLLVLLEATTGNVVHMQIGESASKDPLAKSTNGAPFRFARQMGNNMVLQRAPYSAVVHGFSDVGDVGMKVILQMNTPTKSLNYTTHVVRRLGFGEWRVNLDPQPANTRVNIVAVSERGTIKLNNVIFGDVWICSGQSNMEFTVGQLREAKAEVADAAHYPDIRVMTASLVQSDTPLNDLNVWQNWTAANVPGALTGGVFAYFSAVCWLYGKGLYNATGVPQGLISSNWGGTPIGLWSSHDALKKCGRDVPHGAAVGGGERGEHRNIDRLTGPPLPTKYTVLWNAMIFPLLNTTIKGAIWYQGEADAGQPIETNSYNCTFPAMINDWREKFSQSSGTDKMFPFGFVQLAPNRRNHTKPWDWPDIRWHSTADVGYVPNPKMPNVFMAVAVDLPDNNSSDPDPYGTVHPRDKADVGHRLALAGLAVAYGNKSITYQGPFPVKVSAIEFNGTTSGVNIDYGNTTIHVKDFGFENKYDEVGFEVLCGDKWMAFAITQHSNTSVTLQTFATCSIGSVTAVRYLWKESPCGFKICPVYGVSGLPAPPFYLKTT